MVYDLDLMKVLLLVVLLANDTFLPYVCFVCLKLGSLWILKSATSNLLGILSRTVYCSSFPVLLKNYLRAFIVVPLGSSEIGKNVIFW